MITLYVILSLLIGVPVLTLIYSRTVGVIDKLYYSYVTWGFYTGMELKRKAERGDLNLFGKVYAYLFVAFIFLPSDMGLSSIVSRKCELKPEFKLTTTLVSEILGCDVKTHADKRNKELAIMLRKMMDDELTGYGLGIPTITSEQVIQAAIALKIFDIIDTKVGDTGHFKNANDYRSKFDPDLI